MEKKIAFRSKNRQQIGFSEVFRSTMRRFGISPYDSDDAQTVKIATHVDGHVVATIKETFTEKKIPF